MQGDPYSQMIRLMREQGAKYNKRTYVIGTIISDLPNLLIKIEEMQVDKSDLLINEYLVSDTCVICNNCPISTGGPASNGYLKKGDKVLIIPTDFNKYIVVCKLV